MNDELDKDEGCLPDEMQMSTEEEMQREKAAMQAVARRRGAARPRLVLSREATGFGRGARGQTFLMRFTSSRMKTSRAKAASPGLTTP